MSRGNRIFAFLGTGTSVGVPMIGCDCPVCRSDNPKNHRYRSSALIRTPNGNILIDTGPELRLQLIREKVSVVHAVLYTHYHVDHLYGLDDLRLVAKHLGGSVPLYCTEEVEKVIRKTFSYAFTDEDAPVGFLPKLHFQRIDPTPFDVLGETITPIPLIHSSFNVFGFRIGDMAYCTDVSEIPETSWPLLEGVQTLVIDCLRYKGHPAHMGLNEALEVIERLNPEKAYFTHMSHELDYETLPASLPGGVEMAYDGLRFEF
ncbi:MBL fold metallo-hydrolase [Zavarzinella formosa]|uniref:MBL fold metallo-hydrolase n=1 Tax=Zavarzinella formosa TaxID=360055 RepID=UPI000317530A|nr:MBL fold metallo-hydrolase [Zavarzinella formosa]